MGKKAKLVTTAAVTAAMLLNVGCTDGKNRQGNQISDITSHSTSQTVAEEKVQFNEEQLHLIEVLKKVVLSDYETFVKEGSSFNISETVRNAIAATTFSPELYSDDIEPLLERFLIYEISIRTEGVRRVEDDGASIDVYYDCETRRDGCANPQDNEDRLVRQKDWTKRMLYECDSCKE
jgi:hypothetical protein